MRSFALLRVSAVLLATAPVLVAILHVVSPDLAPRSRRLSEYANGPYGYLMTVAFLAVGSGLLLLAAAMHVHRRGRRVPGAVRAGLAVAGAGMVASGVWATDPGDSDSLRESIHSLASGLASVALVGAALWWLVVDRRRPPTDRQLPRSAAVAAVVAAGLAVASPWLHRSSWTGLSQRALWLALLGWLCAVVWALRCQWSGRHVSGDVSADSAPPATIDA